MAITMALLLLAAGSGSMLAWRHVARRGGASLTIFGAIHASLGIGGLIGLVLALQGPPRGVAMGAGMFGTIAAYLIAPALFVGLIVPFMRRGKGLMIAVHAGVAITGIVIFLAWAALGPS